MRRPEVLANWGGIAASGLIGICAPTEAELRYSARSAAEMEQLAVGLGQLYTWWELPDGAWRRLGRLQLAMASAGHHRAPSLADLLVAVTALHHDLTVLHYDRDFETIAQHTELKTRWLAEPGSLD